MPLLEALMLSNAAHPLQHLDENYSRTGAEKWALNSRTAVSNDFCSPAASFDPSSSIAQAVRIRRRPYHSCPGASCLIHADRPGGVRQVEQTPTSRARCQSRFS